MLVTTGLENTCSARYTPDAIRIRETQLHEPLLGMGLKGTELERKWEGFLTADLIRRWVKIVMITANVD